MLQAKAGIQASEGAVLQAKAGIQASEGAVLQAKARDTGIRGSSASR